LEIKGKVRAKNVVIDHLSGLIVGSYDAPNNDAFPDEHLFVISLGRTPWFRALANYVTFRFLPLDLAYIEEKVLSKHQVLLLGGIFSTNYAMMGSIDDTSLRRKFSARFLIASIIHVEDTVTPP